ncbi:MAG: YHS domain-containing protein [Elusimicrobia bacterium]|nr:YHS domain-containing protein [Elusimicrobiota bacterium]
MQDVVCGLEVNEEDAAAKSQYDGRTFYFCSEGCKRRFDADPAKYDKAFERGVQKTREDARSK